MTPLARDNRGGLARLPRQALAAWLLLACAAPACGARMSPVSPSLVSPADSSDMLTGSVPAFQVSRHAWTPARSGTLSVSLAWPDTTVDLDLYVAPAACLTLYPQTPCGVLASSRGATSASETVSVTVQAGQALALFVDNLDVSRAQGYTLAMSQR